MTEHRYITCPTCYGVGKQRFIGEEYCWDCHGTGRDPDTEFYATICKTCKGKRKLPYNRLGPCSNIKCEGGRIRI